MISFSRLLFFNEVKLLGYNYFANFSSLRVTGISTSVEQAFLHFPFIPLLQLSDSKVKGCENRMNRVVCMYYSFDYVIVQIIIVILFNTVQYI